MVFQHESKLRTKERPTWKQILRKLKDEGLKGEYEISEAEIHIRCIGLANCIQRFDLDFIEKARQTIAKT